MREELILFSIFVFSLFVFGYGGGSNSRHPEVLWAQRSDKVYLTVALPDAKDISVKCEPQGLFSFSALGVQGEPFDFSLTLYGPIVPEVRELLLN